MILQNNSKNKYIIYKDRVINLNFYTYRSFSYPLCRLIKSNFNKEIKEFEFQRKSKEIFFKLNSNEIDKEVEKMLKFMNKRMKKEGY